jgi:hypothetical protein
MAKWKPRPPDDAPADEAAAPIPDKAIREGVLRSLGLTAGQVVVVVRGLWPGRYRVNVLTGPDAATVRMTHSFFVVADDEGAILSSTPEMTRPVPRPPTRTR